MSILTTILAIIVGILLALLAWFICSYLAYLWEHWNDPEPYDGEFQEPMSPKSAEEAFIELTEGVEEDEKELKRRMKE